LFTTRLVICANKVNMFNFDFTGTLKQKVIMRFVWNSLPLALRALDSVENFSKHLKTHLFRQAFN